MHEARPDSIAQSGKKVRESIVRWLRSAPRPIGLMACNDDLGKEIVEACRQAGLRVPDDAAVIGADNDEWSAVFPIRRCRAWPSTSSAPVTRRRAFWTT